MDAQHPSATAGWRTGDERMDSTHAEFLALLDALRASDAEARWPLFERLLAHTEAHFAQEERWLRAIGFAEGNCHAMQHAAVLGTLREVEHAARRVALDLITPLVEALADWFAQHAVSMDAGLAAMLQQAGFDSGSETFSGDCAFAPAHPTGCGSARCA